MENENKLMFKNQPQVFLFVNFGLLIISNMLTLYMWYKILFTSYENDNMFSYLTVTPLFILSIYFLILLIWAIRLFNNRQKLQGHMTQMRIILIMTIIPLYFTLVH
jgi:hypothetical protein